jgi:hypothetical protein
MFAGVLYFVGYVQVLIAIVLVFVGRPTMLLLAAVLFGLGMILAALGGIIDRMDKR